MRTIGKVAVVACTLSLAFALSACGGSASSSAASSAASSTASSAASSSSASSASASASASASGAASSSASASTSSASSASASTSASSSTASSASSSVSASEATTYTNAYFGLDFDLPAGWTFTDAAALKSMNSPVANAAGSDAIEMVAVSDDQNTVVIVALVEPGSENAGKTADTFLQEQTESMEASLEGNYTYTTTEGNITFNGLSRTLPATFTTITSGGSTLVIGQTVAEKDGYFLDVLATGTSEAEVENVFSAFSSTTE